jgi:hypothetical protein
MQPSVIWALDCPIAGSILSARTSKGSVEELRMNKVIRSDGRIPIKKGLWCPLRKMYFPKIFAFIGGDPSEDDMPISCLYTLDPRAVSLIEGVGVVPIDRIDETCQRHNRAKSLILRHHERSVRVLDTSTGSKTLPTRPTGRSCLGRGRAFLR